MELTNSPTSAPHSPTDYLSEEILYWLPSATVVSTADDKIWICTRYFNGGADPVNTWRLILSVAETTSVLVPSWPSSTPG